MTVIELLESSLRVGGIIGEAETLNATAAVDAKEALNVMLTSQPWQGLALVALTNENFPTVAAQASYTMGASGNFNTVRPTKINKAWLRDSANLDTPLKINDLGFYADISDKTSPGQPTDLYISYGYPLATLYFYYVPDAVYTVYLESEKPLTEVTTLTATISLPPGYLAALKWNLALELMPEYGKEPSQFQFKQAKDYLGAIKNLNAANRVQAVKLDTPWTTDGGGFDIRNPD